MPLYLHKDFMDLSFGDRLGHFIKGNDEWWDFANDKVAQKKFSKCCNCN